jgi:hypothetical protein
MASRLCLGADLELVMTSLRLAVAHETALALIERVDPVLSSPVESPRRRVTSTLVIVLVFQALPLLAAGLEQPIDDGVWIVRVGRPSRPLWRSGRRSFRRLRLLSALDLRRG